MNGLERLDVQNENTHVNTTKISYTSFIPTPKSSPTAGTFFIYLLCCMRVDEWIDFARFSMYCLL